MPPSSRQQRRGIAISQPAGAATRRLARGSRAASMRRAVAVLAVVLVGSIGTAIAWRSSPPSRPAIPDFSLPPVTSAEPGLRAADLRRGIALLNVWATWCVGCRQEHAVLMDIGRSGEVPLFGLNYRDARAQARRWLDRLGNPYVRDGFDADGRVAAHLGVGGAPETFVLDEQGRVLYRHRGPVSRAAWEKTLRPLVRSAVARARDRRW